MGFKLVDGGVAGNWRLSQKVQPLSEILLEEIQQHDLIVLAGFRAADAVPLVGIDLRQEKQVERLIWNYNKHDSAYKPSCIGHVLSKKKSPLYNGNVNKVYIKIFEVIKWLCWMDHKKCPHKSQHIKICYN